MQEALQARDCLGVYTGDGSGLQRLFDRLATCRASAGLYACPVPDESLAAFGADRSQGCALIFHFGADIPRAIANALLQDRGWRLYWRPVAGERTPAEDAERGLAVPGAPRGAYVDWDLDAYPARVPQGTGIVTANNGFVRLDGAFRPFPWEGGGLALTPLFQDSDREPQAVASAQAAATPPTELELPVRLISTGGRPRRSRARRVTAAELERRIEALEEELADALREQVDDDALLRLWLYRESGADHLGTSTRLRRWFASAPDERIGRYQHVRIQVRLEGAGCDDLAVPLHAVTPLHFAADGLPPPCTPWRTLVLDPAWSSPHRGRVFICENEELRPLPPALNGWVSRLMVDRLWEGINGTGDQVLAVLRLTSGRAVRFGVGGFRPLSEQTAALNPTITSLHRADAAPPAEDVMGQLLAEARTGLARALEDHVTDIGRLLRLLWTGVRDRLGDLRAGAREALDAGTKACHLQSEIAQMAAEDARVWDQFVREVLSQDREILQAAIRRSGPLPEAARSLDAAREMLSQAMASGQVQHADSLLARIALLEGQVRNLQAGHQSALATALQELDAARDLLVRVRRHGQGRTSHQLAAEVGGLVTRLLALQVALTPPPTAPTVP